MVLVNTCAGILNTYFVAGITFLAGVNTPGDS
jgi:hypothetical protein